MEITKMLTISTAHISNDTCKRLKETKKYESGFGLSVYPKAEWGWFIFISEDFKECSVPDDLMACCNLANEHGCEWLCLDSDGELVPGLPLYEW